MQENLQEKLLVPTYIPKQITYKETDVNNHAMSIHFETFRRKKQIGYGMKLGNYELDQINHHESEFNNISVSCWLKDAINVAEFPEKRIEEEIGSIQGISINQVLIEEKQYNDRMKYCCRITFEYNGYEYTIMSEIYGYYSREVLQDVKTELIKVVESMLRQ